MPEQNLQFIIGLYLGLLDRMPDEDGLRYWVSAMEQGATREQIVKGFLDSSEFMTRSGASNAKEVIETVYSNAFDRPAEELGLGYWVDAVASGRPLAQVISQILLVTEDLSNGDGQRLTNAIQSFINTRDTAVRLGVDQYWQGAEVDGITNDPISVIQHDAMEQVRLGAKAPMASQVRVDNVIDGNKIDALVLDGTNLNDLIILGPKALSVFARDGDDHVQGSDLGTMFWPGNGNDTVEAGAGADIIDARPDAPASIRDAFYGQDGDDFIFGGIGSEFIDGGDGKDFISAGGGNDTVRGGIGNDEILKDGGGDFNILGEAGDDKITVRNAATNTGIINGGAGNDTINADTIYSLSIFAGSGDDTATLKNIEHGGYVLMEDGNDTLTGVGLKSMTIDMGAGNDRVILRNASNVTVILGDGKDTIEIYDSDNVVIQGGGGEDTIRITNSTNVDAHGNAGANNFYVDKKSLTSAINLIGGSGVSEKCDGCNNWFVPSNMLTITDLKNGDILTLNKDNFSTFARLEYDYNANAQIKFESNPEFGSESKLRISNSNNETAYMRSKLWILQGSTPFENLESNGPPTKVGEWNPYSNIFEGSYDCASWQWENSYKMKSLDVTDVPKRLYPFSYLGDLQISWLYGV